MIPATETLQKINNGAYRNSHKLFPFSIFAAFINYGIHGILG